MRLLTTERLNLVRTVRDLSMWGAQDPYRAADIARQEVFAAGVCLPPVWFCGGPIVPVVRWDHENLDQRLRSSRGPILVRSLLADRLEHGRDHLEPAVLSMVGFISVARLDRSRSVLAAASAYAPAVAAVPAAPPAGIWHAFEFDFYGLTVAEVDQGLARVVVQGLQRPKGRAGGVPHQRRLLEEQLFDVAARTESVPGVA